MSTFHSTGYEHVRVHEEDNIFTVTVGTEVSHDDWCAKFKCLDHALDWIENPANINSL